MAALPHILVVDDDGEIRDLLSRFLAKHGFKVTTTGDGRQMAAALDANPIDLVILDLMLPGEDGLSICRGIRQHSAIPIIMLTAMGDDADRIVGLEIGADDYVPKPFNPRELLARVKAVLRRSEGNDRTRGVRGGNAYRFEGWILDSMRRELVAPDGRLVNLTGGEFDLLIAFVEHPKRILTRDQILDLTRGRNATPFDRSVDILVSRLRQKIEPDSKEPKFIKTVRAAGYVFAAAVES
ncbi:MAG: response regulator [Rhodospirillaceae bacterium]|nr:response regulator [Rhodospirillaceae bacterium]